MGLAPEKILGHIPPLLAHIFASSTSQAFTQGADLVNRMLLNCSFHGTIWTLYAFPQLAEQHG